MGETTGCEMFDFLQKKDDKPRDDAVMIDTEQVQESELKEKKEEQKHTFAEEHHHNRRNSSSSSDEEGGERKKKKKKGLKEKIKDKISNENEEDAERKNAPILVEKCNEEGNAEALQPEEKKGIFEKIKEILPGQYKNTEEGTLKPPSESEADGHNGTMEKKGFMEKIKEKFPGVHKNGEEEKKEN